MNFWRLCLLLKMTRHSKTEMHFQVLPGNENFFLLPSSFVRIQVKKNFSGKSG
jgi:hypothetical protein